MSKSDIVKEWLQIASDEHYAASCLFDVEHRKPLEVICYLCQQSVEKSLKGFLCSNGVIPPKTHELGILCNMCAEYNAEFLNRKNICVIIENYATKTRYPSRMELTEHDAKVALKNALTIYEFVTKLLNIQP